MTRHIGFPQAFAAATLLLVLTGTQRATAGQYSIDYLIAPFHPNVVDSWLLDINNQGQSTGYMVQRPPGGASTRAAVTYHSGTAQMLAVATTFAGDLGTAGLAINNHGDVLGNLDGQPYFFGAGGPTVPIEVPGQFVSVYVAGSNPGGLNDAGNALISTFPDDPNDIPPDGYSGLAIWNQSGAQALSALNPLYPYMNPPDPNDFNSGPSSSAGTVSVTHLNHANQFSASIHVFGFDPMDPANPDDDVFSETFTHAYVYDGQGGFRILEVPTPGEEVRPIDIDELGTVFGWAGGHLALWGPDGMLSSILPDPGTTLDDLGYGGFATAQRNNLGHVVALTLAGGALFYDPISNTWSDLNSSIDGLGTGTFSTIQGFNDLGQFVGLARPPLGGGVFGYVVSPVPEPAAATLFLIGFVVLGAVARRASALHKVSSKA